MQELRNKITKSLEMGYVPTHVTVNDHIAQALTVDPDIGPGKIGWFDGVLIVFDETQSEEFIVHTKEETTTP